MKRLLASALVGVLLAGAAWGQDEIIFYNRAKNREDDTKGRIVEETPNHVAYVISGRTEKVPAADVIDIVYHVDSALLRNEYRGATRREEEIDKAKPEDRKKAVQEALSALESLRGKLADSQFAPRHMDYKMARILAREAEERPEYRDRAVAALKKFVNDHGGGWQTGEAVRMLARLQAAGGDVAGAQKTYEDLIGRGGLLRDTRQEYEILLIQFLLRNGKAAAAHDRLKQMALRLEEKDPMAARVRVYLLATQADVKDLAAAEKQLKAVLAGDAPGEVKGLASNTLGELYLKAGRSEDAFWQFLWVDVVYNQDALEHARALHHLSTLFDKVKNDPDRARECRDRLRNEKQFAGSEHQKMALKEK
jgi:hypothetical protein